MLAQRMSSFSGSGTAKARAAAKAAKDAGMDVINLTAGEIWTDPPKQVRDGAIAAIEAGVNRYTDSVGIEPLRDAIANRIARETGLEWGAENIAVTAGAKQALFNVALALFDPGDEILVPDPPPMNLSTFMVRRRRTEDVEQTSQARGDRRQAAPG